MRPRLKSSKKWASLPQEQIEQIQAVFAESFKKALQGGQVTTQGRIYPEELIIQVSYSPLTSIKTSHFEASIGYDKDKENITSLIYLTVDCIGSMMHEYFFNNKSKNKNSKEPEHLSWPPTWEAFTFEGKEVFLQYSTINIELENKANELLGEESLPPSNDLVQEHKKELSGSEKP